MSLDELMTHVRAVVERTPPDVALRVLVKLRLLEAK